MTKMMKVIVDELPRNCYMCPFGIHGNRVYIPATAELKRYWYQCFLTQKKMTSTKRNRFCPLEEVNKNDD